MPRSSPRRAVREVTLYLIRALDAHLSKNDFAMTPNQHPFTRGVIEDDDAELASELAQHLPDLQKGKHVRVKVQLFLKNQ